MEKVLVLGAGELQIPTIKELMNNGFYTIVVDYDSNAPGRKLGSIFFQVSTLDYVEVLSLAEKYKVSAVVTAATDRPMTVLAKISDKLELNIVSENVIRNANNKFQMRTILQESGIKVPKFRKIHTFYEIIDFMNQNKGIDFILKPTDNSGSRGISFIKRDSRIKEVSKAFDYTISQTELDYILIEEYMSGNEISVESIMINGVNNIIAMTDKVTSGPPHFVEIGHSQPSKFVENYHREVAELIQKSLEAIGYKKGVSHIEIKLTPDGPKIVEIGLRLGGDCITSHLVPLSTGINMVKANIFSSLGRIFKIRKNLDKGSAIKYIPQVSGVLKEVIIPELNTDYFSEIVINYNKGDNIKNLFKSSNERLGYVICNGETAEDALKNCDEIISKIIIKYD